MNIQILYDRFVSVSKGHMLEWNLSSYIQDACSRFWIWNLLRFIEDLENSFHPCKCCLYLCWKLGHLWEGFIALPDISDESLEIAHGQHPLYDKDSPGHRHASDTQIYRQRNQRTHHGRDKLCFQSMLLKSSVDLFKPFLGRLLPSEQQDLIVSRI